MKSLIAIVCLFLFSSCFNHKTVLDSPDEEEVILMIDKEATGTAQNHKGGAVLNSESDNTSYWIEDFDSWENLYLNKKVIVHGEFFIRKDNPVFLDTSEIKSQGIPVSTESELEANAWRFWIRNVTIELLE